MGKTRKYSEEIRKLRGERLKSVLKRYNLKYSDLYPVAPNASSVSAWLGGYAKGYLSEAKSIELINTFFPDVRLNYLLGIDDYMTENEKILKEWDDANDILSDSINFHELALARMFGAERYKLDSENYTSICEELDDFMEFLALKTKKRKEI